jgi:hypothetical protein
LVIWLVKTVLVLLTDASCLKLFQPVPPKYLNEKGKENESLNNFIYSGIQYLATGITIFTTVSS